jgi:hypothetical protein
MASFHTFGAYSNFYLTSLFKKKDFSTRKFNFYITVKTGLYFVPAKDTDFTGTGFNCYFGIGSAFYPFERLGIFGEVGGDYFSYMDSELNRFSIRAGISIRLYRVQLDNAVKTPKTTLSKLPNSQLAVWRNGGGKCGFEK